ncbi:MAG: hypothetical protein FWD15_05175 [Alphaproteobacteria bacterium]|nr:hypothetical protein [Alphaproteobacteria bacterium]
MKIAPQNKSRAHYDAQVDNKFSYVVELLKDINRNTPRKIKVAFAVAVVFGLRKLIKSKTR